MARANVHNIDYIIYLYNNVNFAMYYSALNLRPIKKSVINYFIA